MRPAQVVARAVNAALLRAWPLPQLEDDSDKEDRGLTLVIAGSAETPGAALLAAVGALRAGCGKLVVATAASVAPGLALRLPEARVIGLAETRQGGLSSRGLVRLDGPLEDADAILLGPGLSDERATGALVKAIQASSRRKHVVLDALAIGAARQVGRFEQAPLLTPHAGEMARLTGHSRQAVERDPLGHACVAARRLNAVVALKGARTFVATPTGECWCHESRQIGLATSGSGDVLAGVIAGLASRGATLAQAAVWGVFLHAAAGRVLARSHGEIGFLAREIAGLVPAAMRSHSRTAAGVVGRRAQA